MQACIYLCVIVQGTEAKYGIILEMICPILGKKYAINQNFHDLLYYSSTFSLKFSPV